MIDGQQQVSNARADRVAELEAENACLRAKLTDSEQTLERLRQAYTNALEQLQLAKRKLFMAKAERREAVPEQLQLDLLTQQVEQLGKELNQAETAAKSDTSTDTTEPAQPNRQ